MEPTPNPTADAQGERDTSEVREYNRKRRGLALAEAAVSIAALLLLLLAHWTTGLRDIAWNAAGERYSLALFYYVVMLAAIAKIASAGLDFHGFRLEHEYHLSNQGLGSWLLDEWKGWLVGLLLGTIIAELIYFLIRLTDMWWLLAWLAFILLFVLLARIAPVLLLPLFYRFVPLEDEDLKQRLVRLGERAGTRVRGVYEWKLSEKSKKANAALTGLGKTRRILLSDTLLAHYGHDEIEAVLAHEFGHHVHRHILKSIGVQSMISLIGFWAADVALRYAAAHSSMYSRIDDFANLPLLLLVSSALSLALLPALNAYSRYNERQSDLYCWRAIPSVRPFISAMIKLSEQNLEERNPSRLVEVLFHSHPAVGKRIAAAEAFARKE